MRHIIAIPDLDKAEIQEILDVADDLKRSPQPHFLAGKILGSCFFEPSTRTRLSFESAMLRLGGSCIGFSDASCLSTRKGESLQDTMRMMGEYVDVIVLRHPQEGAAQLASEVVGKPVINAGDGANQHPTQTLLDLYTIRECQGTLENLRIAMVGDLKYGRTVHSLAQTAHHFNHRLYFVSPESLEMPERICHDLKTSGVRFSFHRSLEEVLGKVDIVYMTRVQEERFPSSSEFEKVKHFFTLTPTMLEKAKRSMRVLHPLPRCREIDLQVDKTPFAYYFQQAKNALAVRQAILMLVLQPWHNMDSHDRLLQQTAGVGSDA